VALQATTALQAARRPSVYSWQAEAAAVVRSVLLPLGSWAVAEVVQATVAQTPALQVAQAISEVQRVLAVARVCQASQVMVAVAVEVNLPSLAVLVVQESQAAVVVVDSNRTPTLVAQDKQLVAVAVQVKAASAA
jgi:hypothetical protein